VAVVGIKRQFLLHVDGAGSYLIVRSDMVELGPMGVARRPDVPIMTAATAPTITLSRCDEDCFLSTRVPVAVNDRTVTSALLCDGDRIGLGPRCRIEYRRPNPASASAVLRITGGRLPWGAVREVLLMGRELVIDPSPSAHVRAPAGSPQVVLHARDDGIWCRSLGGICVNGQAVGQLAGVSAGARVSAGTLNFVLQPD
jgi:hypothetical protein